MQEFANSEPKIIQTDIGAKDGQNKCPKCGATDIGLNSKTGKLRCNYCRYEFEAEKLEGMETDVTKLQGETIASGAQNIVADTQDVVTLKCSSCGAEVVIDTSEATQARCHWCRNTLSINQQIPNGAVPDVVLPFNLTKEEAKEHIEKYVGKRKFFAHPKFKAEFTTENIMGVYLPYMLVDVNGHARFIGEGEHEVRRYTRKSGNSETTYYDADRYDVEREFDIAINGLSVETSSDKLDKNSSSKTNNVINAIMPFDTENCVKFNANYLKGFTSEKRDTSIDDIKPIVDVQTKDIARYAANQTLKEYDRGVRWDTQDMNVKGRQWKTAYLPVWLYSYMQENNVLHYVAVNARTKETVGSVPINMPLLIIATILVGILTTVLSLAIFKEVLIFLVLMVSVAYFLIMKIRYRRTDARHHHESETNNQISGVRTVDRLTNRLTHLTRSKIEGVNNDQVSGQTYSEKLMGSGKLFERVK